MSATTSPAPSATGTGSYSQSFLNITFQIGQGSFGDSGYNTVRLTGLRASATVTRAGGVSMSSLSLKIYGLTLSMMNQLTALGLPQDGDVRKNTVIVEAGTGSNPPALVFQGTIFTAWPDYEGAPDVALEVVAREGLVAATAPVPALSFPGTADASQVLSGIASQNGWTFENSQNVHVQLANPYFPGAAWQQAQSCAQQAGINIVLENNTLAIWPKGGARGGQVQISAQTGMIGYPTFMSQGIRLVTLFNPALKAGGTCVVTSVPGSASTQTVSDGQGGFVVAPDDPNASGFVPSPANGEWRIDFLAHNLESQTPNGAWFSQLRCSTLGGPPQVVNN